MGVRSTYIFKRLKVKIGKLCDIEWLVAKDLSAVGLEDGVKAFGEAELLSVFAGHVV